MPNAPHRHYETIAEAAERLHVSVKTCRRLIADGSLKAYRLGPQIVRLDPAEVDALVQRRTIPTGRAA